FSATLGASTASAGLAGHAVVQGPMPLSPTTLGDTKINGSSPTRKVASAIPMTAQAVPPGRAPGKASSSQGAPSAAAPAPSIPIRKRTETEEPEKLETKTS